MNWKILAIVFLLPLFANNSTAQTAETAPARRLTDKLMPPKPNESVFLSPAIINFPNKRMSHTDVKFFVDLESAVWKALLAGDMQSDGRLLADDFLGVYKSGFAGKSEHVDQLSDGPTVSEFKIEDARICVLSEGLVLLAYRAEWVRISEKHQLSKHCTYITSIWKQVGKNWINVFSQDTDAA